MTAINAIKKLIILQPYMFSNQPYKLAIHG